jgi:hypothetical protein
MALTDAQREAIYRLRLRKPTANGLFTHLAGLKLKMKETSVTVVEKSSGLNRHLSLALMREIESTGVATVRGGGGGQESYLAWADGVDCREYRRQLTTAGRRKTRRANGEQIGGHATALSHGLHSFPAANSTSRPQSIRPTCASRKLPPVPAWEDFEVHRTFEMRVMWSSVRCGAVLGQSAPQPAG